MARANTQMKSTAKTTTANDSLPQMADDTANSANQASPSIVNDSLPQITDDAANQASPSIGGSKESEPVPSSAGDSFAEEEKLIAQIRGAEEVVDKEAIAIVEKELSGIKQSHPQPSLPPDVEDAGVISPQEEADKVVTQGPSISLPIDENDYKKGKDMPAKGKWQYYEKEVVGVKSLVAMALWVTRVVKLAHKHAKRVIFRKAVTS